MQKRLILILCFFAVLRGAAQQDPQYSLYQFNQLLINPAYAGAREVLAGVAHRRQQWVGVDGAPVTNCLSLHAPLMNRKVGAGLTVISDQMGPRNLIAAYGNLAYILKISDGIKLSFGLNAGYNRFQFESGNIDFKTDENSAHQAGPISHGFLDLNSGIYLRSNTFFLGISGTHLNSPTAYVYETSGGPSDYISKLKTHLTLNLGKSFVISENLIFAPTGLVKYVAGNLSADINMNFLLHQRLWLGGFYRTGYGPGALMQFSFNNRVRAGISYDTGMQGAARLGPSFEAMFGFDIEKAGPKKVNARFL